MRFDKKVALVTGAGSGIGLATARRLADEGATVCAAVFEEAQRDQTAGLDTVVLDVRSEEMWDLATAHLVSRYAGADILVNNAGINRRGTVESTSYETWCAVMDTNAWGTVLGCKKMIPLMRQRGGGAIVNVSSVNALSGVPDLLAYNASKGALHALTMSIAMDHAGENIRVNCVCPGAVTTQLHGETFDEQASGAEYPMDRLARPEEVAATIAFLASDDASFMTGLAVPVDGGRLTQF